MSCTDGVGTKLKLAFLTGRHDTVGIDLVAMCVNDLVVCGAEPLFFLDYFASGKLEVGVAERVIAGHRRRLPGRRAAPCSAARPPSCPASTPPASTTWPASAWAWSRRAARVDGRAIAAGDRLLGLASSGFHSNGYSLVRRVFLEQHAACELGARAAAGSTRAARRAALLRPTRIYVRALRALHDAGLLRGAAHITGGGLVDNPTRMLPAERASSCGSDLRQLGGAAGIRADRARAATSPTTRCGAPSTWASACSSACRPSARPRRERCSSGRRAGVHASARSRAADAPDAPVEFLARSR